MSALLMINDVISLFQSHDTSESITANIPKTVNFDANLFTQRIEHHCKGIIQQCPQIERMIKALQYYQHLDITNNSENEGELMHFLTMVYKGLLDDFAHVVTTHNDSKQLEQIFDTFVKGQNPTTCAISSCPMAFRSFRDKTKDTIENSDQEFLFYRDTMDQLHCYLHHLFDMGLRVKPSEINADFTFPVIREIIKQKANTTKSFDNDRYGTNKFCLTADNIHRRGISVSFHLIICKSVWA